MKHEPIKVTFVQTRSHWAWRETIGGLLFFAVLFGLAVLV